MIIGLIYLLSVAYSFWYADIDNPESDHYAEDISSAILLAIMLLLPLFNVFFARMNYNKSSVMRHKRMKVMVANDKDVLTRTTWGIFKLYSNNWGRKIAYIDRRGILDYFMSIVTKPSNYKLIVDDKAYYLLEKNLFASAEGFGSWEYVVIGKIPNGLIGKSLCNIDVGLVREGEK